ncbi:response regulator transcription factor [Acutalibacter sp.]|uniref:response regulator transcription factor n=1 Tax=Acutalibacter sp. TaxID=1918636 RepID=UPI002171A187|nr:response regulator transcription factor [Acutalibacter sp.]
MPNILIVEDDTDINNSTAQYLRRHGCRCFQAFSGTEGRTLWKSSDCDLLLVDLMLPGLSGSELIGEIRRESPVPVIVLSARSELSDKVELLGLGADDYLTKPYQLEELWARIQVQLRHASAAPASEALRFRDWRLNTGEMLLVAAGQPVELTAHEFKIVELMVRRPRKVFTKQQIYEAVWQEECAIEDKTIHVHISNIRAKLRPSGTEGYIQTVWGIGFKLG